MFEELIDLCGLTHDGVKVYGSVKTEISHLPLLLFLAQKSNFLQGLGYSNGVLGPLVNFQGVMGAGYLLQAARSVELQVSSYKKQGAGKVATY